MYKTIVVEDEPDVREAIINTIDWEQKGFLLVGEAGNGQEALELIGQVEPDLVITDIKMPFMNGIELATAIREVNPVTKIVFLSGFNEFDYAVSALKLNVIEYILKPVSRQELSDVLDAIRQKLDKEKQRTRDIALLQERFDRERTILKNSFLISLVKGSPTSGEISAKLEKYGLRFSGDCFQLFTLSIDRASLSESHIDTDDAELLLLSVSDIAEKVGGKYMGMESFLYEENLVGILSDKPENMEAYTDILLREMRQHIQKYCGFSVTIGVSRPYGSLLESHVAYTDSISALHYRLVGEGGRVIYIGDYERGKDEDIAGITDAQAASFNSLIKTGRQEELSAFIKQLFDGLLRQQASMKAYQTCILELFSLLLKAAKTTSEDPGFHIGNSLSYMAELYKKDTTEEIRVWFERLCHQVMAAISKQRKDNVDILAEQACDYIAAHYGDCELSLKTLGDRLHISPNYLSSVLKKARGTSFSGLLTRTRMEKAYELLASTGGSIQMIAEATGYADRHYFSYCFKKYYEESPVQMRNRLKTEREHHESSIS